MRFSRALAHDREKRESVFQRDHAPTKFQNMAPGFAETPAFFL
jgi:hypothetical protein